MSNKTKITKFGDSGEQVLSIQRLLNAQGFTVVVDGNFGPVTQQKVIDFQTKKGLKADGVVGPVTMSALSAKPVVDKATSAPLEQRHLLTKDFQEAASLLDCSVAAIMAVCEVEAPRGGFNPDGTPVTLFEGHKFYAFTKGRFGLSNVSYPSWDRTYYARTWVGEQTRLKKAIQLDRTAALMSASWGRFQIMGFNFAACNFATVEEFVDAMKESEASQLKSFCEFIITNGLADELRDQRWADFARHYNGAGFRKNQYDVKLAKAFKKAEEFLARKQG